MAKLYNPLESENYAEELKKLNRRKVDDVSTFKELKIKY